MGFSSTFTSVIANLFNKKHAHITDNGMLSEPFNISRGVHQGDPLSPLLYLLSFELFLQKLTNKIQDITIQNHAFKAATYADDLTIGLGSNIDQNSFNEILLLYEKASNAQ
ncbi:10093_t:CDS:1, partial [Gigaspora rosea]